MRLGILIFRVFIIYIKYYLLSLISFEKEIRAKLDEKRSLANDISYTTEETLEKASLLQQIENDLEETKKEVMLTKDARKTAKTRQQEEKQSIKQKIDYLVEKVNYYLSNYRHKAIFYIFLSKKHILKQMSIADFNNILICRTECKYIQ